jgi:hypothetical protein
VKETIGAEVFTGVAVQIVGIPTFRRNSMPPFSGLRYSILGL